MKLNAKTKQLLSAASFAAQSLKTRTTLPILDFLLVKPVENGVRFYGTNLDIMTSQFCPADVGTMDPFLVPSTLFISLLSSATGEDAQITVDGAKVTVEIEMLKAALGTMPASDFVPIEDVIGTEMEFRAEDLESHFSKVVWAASTDPLNRAILCGVNLKIGDGMAKFAATNGKCLTQSTQPMQGDGDYIIPTQAVSIVMAACDHCQNPVKITGNDRKIRFNFGDREIASKLIEGNYPDYQRYMGSDDHVPVEVSRKDLMGVMRRVKLFSTEANFGSVFDFNGTLTVSTENAINSFRESIACKCSTPNKIKLNHEDILNIASRVSGDAVHIGVKDSLSPISVKDGGFTAVSMPLILNK
jgi:DNA polymerase III subunit beta